MDREIRAGVLLAITLAVTVSCSAQTAQLRLIPYSAFYHHVPFCVSADGRFIAGTYDAPVGRRAYRFDTASGALIHLAETSTEVTPQAISDSGAIIVGRRADGGVIRPFFWSEASGLAFLTNNGAPVVGFARCVSADGSVVVGDHEANCGIPQVSTLAFRWVAPSSFTCLGTLDDALISTGAFLSASGNEVAGDANPSGHETVFRWSAAAGMIRLPHLSSWKWSRIVGMTADGSTVFGMSAWTGGSWSPVKWTGSQITAFDLGAGQPIKNLRGVSGDGSTIIGGWGDWDPQGVLFYWHSYCGAKDWKQDVLQAGHGIDAAGWDFISDDTVHLSRDGRTVVGRSNDTGVLTTWYVRLPCFGDVTADGVVNSDDVDFVLFSFGLCCSARWLDGDLNYDQRVDQDDLDIVLTEFGKECP